MARFLCSKELLITVGHGVVGLGWARSGKVRIGKARQGLSNEEEDSE